MIQLLLLKIVRYQPKNFNNVNLCISVWHVNFASVLSHADCDVSLSDTVNCCIISHLLVA